MGFKRCEIFRLDVYNENEKENIHDWNEEEKKNLWTSLYPLDNENSYSKYTSYPKIYCKIEINLKRISPFINFLIWLKLKNKNPYQKLTITGHTEFDFLEVS